jgi:hypothetical protein
MDRMIDGSNDRWIDWYYAIGRAGARSVWRPTSAALKLTPKPDAQSLNQSISQSVNLSISQSVNHAIALTLQNG